MLGLHRITKNPAQVVSERDFTITKILLARIRPATNAVKKHYPELGSKKNSLTPHRFFARCGMAEENPTEIIAKPSTETVTKQETTTTSRFPGSVAPDSRIFGVSIMAWVFLLLTLTVCYCNIFQVPLYDHLMTLSLMIASFYAGQKTGKQSTV